MTHQEKEIVITAVKEASERWKNAFNSGHAAGCAAQYEQSAVMKAEPFGTFEGTDSIQAFWQKLVDDGFSGVEYIAPKIEVMDSHSAILTSGWKMNNAQGVIHRELWGNPRRWFSKTSRRSLRSKGITSRSSQRLSCRRRAVNTYLDVKKSDK